MTQQEIQDRMETCPWRERPRGNPYVCTRYFGDTVLFNGACSWVADYSKLKKLKEQKGISYMNDYDKYFIDTFNECYPFERYIIKEPKSIGNLFDDAVLTEIFVPYTEIKPVVDDNGELLFFTKN